ncbi:type VI secretion system amidase immunity protein Tai4 [Snodgrassella alvi]|uniref:type VI secretion system amidase immunity protein Tai4 n=2 Tax=Snodgrassella TaxID=1193515 RepID=UPI0004D9724D|nr:CagZ [Snodgrassella alvi SCGC AB-598-O11]
MKKIELQILCSLCLLLPSLICNAMSPEAPNRNFLKNYKDMVFATCIANAYKDDKHAAIDAGSSASALQDWIAYSIDNSIERQIVLVNSYLSRDYFNPLAETEVKGLKFDFLKCLDLYHSKELDRLGRDVISEPWRKASHGY